MTDLTPTDTPRPRSSALWDLMRKPGMIYVLVLTLVVITFIARSQIAPTLGSQSLYLFLMPVVLFAGIIGGLGPGLLATFLCLVLHLYSTGEYANLTNVDSPLYQGGVDPRRHFRAAGIWHRLGRRATPPGSCNGG